MAFSNSIQLFLQESPIPPERTSCTSIPKIIEFEREARIEIQKVTLKDNDKLIKYIDPNDADEIINKAKEVCFALLSIRISQIVWLFISRLVDLVSVI